MSSRVFGRIVEISGNLLRARLLLEASHLAEICSGPCLKPAWGPLLGAWSLLGALLGACAWGLLGALLGACAWGLLARTPGRETPSGGQSSK